MVSIFFIIWYFSAEFGLILSRSEKKNELNTCEQKLPCVPSGPWRTVLRPAVASLFRKMRRRVKLYRSGRQKIDQSAGSICTAPKNGRILTLIRSKYRITNKHSVKGKTAKSLIPRLITLSHGTDGT